MSAFGELARKFARKALVPFHELHKGVDRSDPRASALFRFERNTQRGAAADSIHNPARATHTLTRAHTLANLASASVRIARLCFPILTDTHAVLTDGSLNTHI